ncbi:MAG: hypothetical protein WBK91_04600 [Alphaproteobacteria bacterium]
MTQAKKEHKPLLEELDELLGHVAEARVLTNKMEATAGAFKTIERRARGHVSMINRFLH